MTGNPGYFISAPWRSSGKTIFSIGLARAAKRRQLAVQTFKKGPDFIDPLWLASASGSGCYNLDPYIQRDNQWQDTFSNNVQNYSLALVEGTMGLHDGLQSDGSDSNANVAKALNLPVILVVDCRGMHRTVAALVNGILKFDTKVRFAGVVLNRVRSSRHEDKIQTALQQHTDATVLGAIPECVDVHVDEKQLGLTPVTECARTNSSIENAADLVTKSCDLDNLFTDFSAAPVNGSMHKAMPAESRISVKREHLKIGIARDDAFHFYYQDDLDLLKSRGVELIEVSPLNGVFPDNLDGLIIGGGFPERHAKMLADNQQFIDGLRRSIKSGLSVHAECAGLMYLCKRLVLAHGSFDMVGAIAGEVQMCDKPQGRGYMKLQQRDGDTEIRAHEFHHSKITFEKPPEFIFSVLRGHGIDGDYDGIQCNNVQASFAHFRQTKEHRWIDRFIARVQEQRASVN